MENLIFFFDYHFPSDIKKKRNCWFGTSIPLSLGQIVVSCNFIITKNAWVENLVTSLSVQRRF